MNYLGCCGTCGDGLGAVANPAATEDMQKFGRYLIFTGVLALGLLYLIRR